MALLVDDPLAPSETSAAATAVPAALRLVRGVIAQPDLHTPLTCGGVQASRLAWLHGDTYAVASHTNVFSFSISAAASHRSELESVDDECDGNGNVSTVKDAVTDDYIVPVNASVERAALLASHSTHRLEVQTVAASGGRLASVDAAGRVVVTRCRGGGSDVVCVAPDSHSAPPGWAGVALGSDALVAVVRSRAQDLTLYDGAVAVRTFRTRAPPVGVALSPDGQLVCVAAGGKVALYDARDSSSKRTESVSRRVCDGSDVLRALGSSTEGGVVLTAGGDRAVAAFDGATLAPRGRWSPCLKYEPAAVVGGPCGSAGVAAAASIDNEVALGSWAGDATHGMPRSKMLSGASAVAGGRQRVCGFRADVRVVGLARSDDGTIAACSESGAVYVLR